MPDVSTNSRQWIADEHIHNSATSIAGSAQHRAGGLFANLADDLGLASARRQAQGIDGGVGVFGRHNRQELAFISDMERIESEQLAGTAHGIAYRDPILG